MLEHVNGSAGDGGTGWSLFKGQVIPKPLPLGFPEEELEESQSRPGVVLLLGEIFLWSYWIYPPG